MAAHFRYIESIILITFTVFLLYGCSYISNESIYEGFREHDRAKTTGTTQKPADMPNYDKYEKEREALKK